LTTKKKISKVLVFPKLPVYGRVLVALFEGHRLCPLRMVLRKDNQIALFTTDLTLTEPGSNPGVLARCI